MPVGITVIVDEGPTNRRLIAAFVGARATLAITVLDMVWDE